MSSFSSWQFDSLDLGPRLAAIVAAKKGEASSECVADVIQVQRDFTNIEKRDLEHRLEDLREQIAFAKKTSETEDQLLMKELERLRHIVRLRSRFGAWFCEEHALWSDSESGEGESGCEDM